MHIYGPDVESLKGKTVRSRPAPIEDMTRVNMPDTIKDLHPRINLSADFFFVQGIAFLHSISRGYDFRTIDHIKDFRTKYDKMEMLAGVKACINVYHARGLEVTQLNTDNEFACIEEDIRPVKLNVVAANEHVGNVERSTRTIKECTRCHIHRNPYKRYPKTMVTG